MTTHTFPDTGAAYDATQCDETIKSGDVLICTDENVVGIADTWPFAVTDAHGHLHATKDGAEAYAAIRDAEKGTTAFSDGVREARRIIASKQEAAR